VELGMHILLHGTYLSLLAQLFSGSGASMACRRTGMIHQPGACDKVMEAWVAARFGLASLQQRVSPQVPTSPGGAGTTRLRLKQIPAFPARTLGPRGRCRGFAPFKPGRYRALGRGTGGSRFEVGGEIFLRAFKPWRQERHLMGV
jgi:hypothetical protein